MNLTEMNRKWLNQRFSRAPDGSYIGHEPIYGLEGRQFSEIDPPPIIRYARIFQVFRFLNRIPSLRTMLDVGGAEGFVAHLARKILGVRVINFDLSIEANHRARELFDLDGVAGAAHQLPFKSQAFDVVVCLEVIEHLEAPIQSILELNRVCSKHLILSSENFSLSEKERRKRVASRRLHFHFDRNCFLGTDLQVMVGREDLVSVDQRVPVAPPNLDRVNTLKEACDLILQICPLTPPKTDAQIYVKSKGQRLLQQGVLPERVLLEKILSERLEPGRIYFKPPATPAADLLSALACPECWGLFDEEVPLSLEHATGRLVCNKGEHQFDVERGVPLLYPNPHTNPQPLPELLKRRAFPTSAIDYLANLENLLRLPANGTFLEGHIDEPSPTTPVHGYAKVKGWVTDFRLGSRLRVDILLDGRFVGSTENSIPAQDVKEHFDRIGFAAPLQSRFVFDLDTTGLSNGFHSLSVIAKSESGETFKLGQTSFEVAN